MQHLATSAECCLCCTCTQAQELQQVLASISGAEQELQALQEQREQLQPAAKEAAELRSTIAQLQDEVRPCPAATCALAGSCLANWGGIVILQHGDAVIYAAAVLFVVEAACHYKLAAGVHAATCNTDKQHCRLACYACC
jgi:hypothetical protein